MNSVVFVRAAGTPSARAASLLPPTAKVQLPNCVRSSSHVANDGEQDEPEDRDAVADHAGVRGVLGGRREQHVHDHRDDDAARCRRRRPAAPACRPPGRGRCGRRTGSRAAPSRPAPGRHQQHHGEQLGAELRRLRFGTDEERRARRRPRAVSSSTARPADADEAAARVLATSSVSRPARASTDEEDGAGALAGHQEADGGYGRDGDAGQRREHRERPGGDEHGEHAGDGDTDDEADARELVGDQDPDRVLRVRIERRGDDDRDGHQRQADDDQPRRRPVELDRAPATERAEPPPAPRRARRRSRPRATIAP